MQRFHLGILLFGLLFALLFSQQESGGINAAQSPLWQQTLNASDFKRSALVESGMAAKIKERGNLSGRLSSSDRSSFVRGWVEYEVSVPRSGWYELLVQPDALGIEYIIDGKLSLYGYGGQKLSNLWLEAGRHSIRLQRYVWTGFPAITSLTLRESSQDLNKIVRLEVADRKTVLRQGEDLNLRILSGGNSRALALTIKVIDKQTAQIRKTLGVNLPVSRTRRETPVKLSFDQEGIYRVQLSVGERPIDPADVRPIEVVVVDTSSQPRTGGDIQKVLIQEIDCAKQSPDFVGSGGTTVVSTAFGQYRESAEAGWIQQQHMQPIAPSWFAYKITVPKARNAYVLEVDYPDDKKRTFAIAIRDSKPGVYPIAGGVDSGGEFSLTQSRQTHSMIFWPNSTDLRAVLMNAQTGLRAAAAKIRLYRIQGDLPLLNVPRSGGRTFANWYEEGLHFASIYGGDIQSIEGVLTGAEQWARSVAYMGGDMLMPTVAVYQMAMYPSRYNIDFNDPGTPDFVRIIQLKCEKYGLKMVGEFHPEARELEWLEGLPPEKRTNVLRDRQGKIASPNPPRHHPLHPINQKWYADMIGEFVERYKDSPVLDGVSLRLQDWANPGLNNFHSLEWGYDDYTLALFQQETGLRLPLQPNDPERYRKRYDWLMTNAKSDWISWRGKKITELYVKIRDRIKQARPDLKLYTDVFPGFNNLEETGIDVKALSNLNGIRTINALHDYGRRYDGQIYGGTVNQQHRDKLIDPDVLRSMVPKQGNGSFLFGSAYFESREQVIPPQELGFPSQTKAIAMGAVINPAGRHSLERWALALAETDASYLADGGNGYTLGQPLLRNFLQEYRYLPKTPFIPREDARDPVAVWELAQKNSYLFYAVNRERFPVETVLTFNTPGNIRRLSTQQAVPLENDKLKLKLKPYELIAFSAPINVKINAVSTAIPPSSLTQVEQQVKWIQQFNSQIAQNQTCQALTDVQRTTVMQAAQKAALHLKKNWVWHARIGLEKNNMIEIYKRCNQFPPELQFTANR